MGTVEIRVFHRQPLTNGIDTTHVVVMVCDFHAWAFGTCKIGKLSFVAGAEIPKKYLG
jgi:hypothetical protein